MIRNSTIIPKKKMLKCGHYDFNFSKGRCKTCATIEDSLKRIAEHEEGEEDESFSNLVDEADTWFSKWVRLAHADKDGVVVCYTSGKKFHWTQIQCGHFISRKHYATRWAFENARPQSEYENCHLHGNLKVFEQKLNEENPYVVAQLKELSREVSKPTRDDLKQLIIDIRHRVKMLEKTKLKK